MSFSYGLHHVFILRLLKHYHFPPTSSLHNLVFLVSAAKLEPQELGVYDFVRTPMGAFSSYLQEVIDDLHETGLVSADGCQLTRKGKIFCDYYGVSLAPFLSFWKLCSELANRYCSKQEDLRKAVFHHISFRRVRPNEEIFKIEQICADISRY